MAKRSDQNLMVGLDIGTSKIGAIVADIGPNGEIEVIANDVSSSAARMIRAMEDVEDGKLDNRLFITHDLLFSCLVLNLLCQIQFNCVFLFF